GLLLRIAVRNATSQPIQVEQLTPLASERGYRSLPVKRLNIGQMGWQSWSQPHPPQPLAPNLQAVDAPCRSPFLPARWPDSELAPSMAVLTDEAGGPSCLLGFAAGRDFNGAIEVAPARAGHRLRVWCDAEGLTVQPGATLESEPLLIAAGEEDELLARYAGTVAERMGARRWPRVPTGWCSWYHFFTWVTEADCLRNLDWLARRRDTLPMDVFQLDDGYQRQVGDWLALNDKFPSGMPALTAAIRQAGFTPGIWLAPSLLSASSRTYAEHPDWVVLDEAGRPIDVMQNWGSENYALDTTHPEAMDWLEHIVRTMCEEWGYDYLKIDFIYAAAVRGRRRNREITGVQAYRRGLEMIRRLAGERFILGCGAPFLSSVGLVDGMRIGEDVAPFWRREGGGPGPAMANALHSTLLHNWMHQRWWINDPDCVMVREHDSQLSLVEVQA
ncbi:MAG: glycoside hydrolase family 36 protein, partial [Chloroflexota bacterium]